MRNVDLDVQLFCLSQDYVDALMGVCYDGVEGLLYLSLFSLLAACTLSVMLCAVFRLWKLMGSRSAPHPQPCILLHPRLSAAKLQTRALPPPSFPVLLLVTPSVSFPLPRPPGTESTTTLTRRTRSTPKPGGHPTTPGGPTSTVSAASPAASTARPATSRPTTSPPPTSCRLPNTCKTTLKTCVFCSFLFISHLVLR